MEEDREGDSPGVTPFPTASPLLFARSRWPATVALIHPFTSKSSLANSAYSSIFAMQVCRSRFEKQHGKPAQKPCCTPRTVQQGGCGRHRHSSCVAEAQSHIVPLGDAAAANEPVPLITPTSIMETFFEVRKREAHALDYTLGTRLRSI